MSDAPPPPAPLDDVHGDRPRSPWADAWRRLRRDRLAMVCAALIGVYLVLAILAEVGVIAADATTHVSGQEYEDASWGVAWAHLSWPAQTALTTVLLVAALAPFVYLRLGATRRAGLTLGVCAMAALLLAGIAHGSVAMAGGVDSLSRATGSRLDGEVLQASQEAVRVKVAGGVETVPRAEVQGIRVGRFTIRDPALVVGPEDVAAIRAGTREVVALPDGRQRLVDRDTHSFTRHLLGGDIFGRNVFSRTLAGISIAFRIGVVVTLMAIPVGILLGALAGYFGGIVDELIVWLYSTLASIPGLLLILALGFALKQVRGIPDIYVIYFALGTTTWITLCRLIRGEVLKHKSRDYVTAARALGGGHLRCLIRHILPNVVHIVIVRFSLQFIFAVETEVILSYLGVGIADAPSWGRMIDDSKQELIKGEFMNLTGATVALFGLALAFNILGDSLRDALDPRLKQ